MRKGLLGLILLCLVPVVFAQPLPEIPTSCVAELENTRFCSFYDVVYNKTLGQDVANIKMFAIIDPQNDPELSTVEQLVAQFLNFDAWQDYVAGSKHVKYKLTKSLPVTIENGVEVYRHYCKYEMKNIPNYGVIPAQKVVEQAIYMQVPAFDGAEISFKFFMDPTFKEVEGMKYKGGYLHIRYDEENDLFYAYVDFDVIPSFDLGPFNGFILKITGEAAKAALGDVVKGMFGI